MALFRCFRRLVGMLIVSTAGEISEFKISLKYFLSNLLTSIRSLSEYTRPADSDKCFETSRSRLCHAIPKRCNRNYQTPLDLSHCRKFDALAISTTDSRDFEEPEQLGLEMMLNSAVTRLTDTPPMQPDNFDFAA